MSKIQSIVDQGLITEDDRQEANRIARNYKARGFFGNTSSERRFVTLVNRLARFFG